MEESYIYTTPGKRRRVISHIIDLFIISLLFSLIVFIAKISGVVINQKASLWILFSIYFIYYFLSETIKGTTLGKKLLGLYVFLNFGNNEKPSANVIFFRTLFRLIPFEAFVYLFVTDGSGLHDDHSKTFVKYRSLKKEEFTIKDKKFIKLTNSKIQTYFIGINQGVLRILSVLGFIIPFFYTLYKYSDCDSYSYRDCDLFHRFLTFTGSFILYIIVLFIGIWIFRGFSEGKKE